MLVADVVVVIGNAISSSSSSSSRRGSMAEWLRPARRYCSPMTSEVGVVTAASIHSSLYTRQRQAWATGRMDGRTVP